MAETRPVKAVTWDRYPRVTPERCLNEHAASRSQARVKRELCSQPRGVHYPSLIAFHLLSRGVMASSVWIAIGVYVWINQEPAITYDHSPAVATKEECEAIVVHQRERNDAAPDMIGYGIKCVELDVVAKPVPEKLPFKPSAPAPTRGVGQFPGISDRLHQT